jgi:creatinine amidohydrolase
MLHLEDLTWPELDALDRKRTVIFIAFSPLEEHGPHLPIGTDVYMANHFAEAIARQVEAQRPGVTALLLPPIPLGAGTVPMRGSVNVTVDLIFDIARQIGAAYARDGFRHIVFTNGHLSPAHMIALENAALWLSRRYGMLAVAPSASIARAVIQGGNIKDAVGERLSAEELADLLSSAHAGTLETSVMLHLHPDLVRARYATLPPLKRRAMLGWRGRTPAAWAGYVGSPALASAEWGAIAVEALVGRGTQMVLRMLDEGQPGAKAGRFFPRLPFWLAGRRALLVGAAALVGISVTLFATQTFGSGRKTHCGR